MIGKTFGRDLCSVVSFGRSILPAFRVLRGGSCFFTGVRGKGASASPEMHLTLEFG